MVRAYGGIKAIQIKPVSDLSIVGRKYVKERDFSDIQLNEEKNRIPNIGEAANCAVAIGNPKL